MAEHHELMGGKLHVYRRENSGNWQCSTYLNGRNWRVTTGSDSLSLAKEFAEDWYIELRGKSRAGTLKTGKLFKHAAQQFMDEYEVITQGERSQKHVQVQNMRIKVHILPFFKDKVVSEITPGAVQDYRVHRSKTSKTGRPPARSTLHQEVVAIRQILKTANRHGWLEYVPDLSPPYRASGKVSHRAWFSPDEYKRLYEATRERAKNPKNPRWRHECEQLHDYVLFMVNTGLRPDEASRLELRDVAVVTDQATGERILEIEVRGKRGVGYCKSMPGAVLPFQRVIKRGKRAGGSIDSANATAGILPLEQTDRLFGKVQRELLNSILGELKLKTDRDGNVRTAYSLRHTYICMRLMEGADIYQIAKNCRTSVEMIEKFYASHIKNTLDAAAINVRRTKMPPSPEALVAGKARGLRARRGGRPVQAL